MFKKLIINTIAGMLMLFLISIVFSQHSQLYAQAKWDRSYAEVAENCVKSVVNIFSTRIIKMQEGENTLPFFNDPFFRRFFGPGFDFNMPKEREQRSLGSGVLINKDGIILTNNHVVEKSDEIKVSLYNENQYDTKEYDAEILGTDPRSDLAVIKIVDGDGSFLPLKLGDSDEMRLGDVVLAIGNPFGLGSTVTMGIISAKARGKMGMVDYGNFIQTDAAINPGNSGGALINMRGELIGINTAIVSNTRSYQGVGFAIPSNMAREIMKQLIEKGRVVRGYLGVMIQPINEDLAETMGLSDTHGALITEVSDDTPADEAGLESGDIITKVDGEEIKTINQLQNKIADLGPGVEAEITIIRDGEEKELDIKLGELPGEEEMAVKSGTDKDREELMGLSVASLNQRNRYKYRIPDDVENGVIVTYVEPGSPAKEAALMVGDVIKRINRKTIESVDMFKGELRNSGSRILLYIYRGGNNFFTVLKNQSKG